MARQRPVRIIETGVTYPSIRECARAIGGIPSNIHQVLSGAKHTHKGFKFEYVDLHTHLMPDNPEELLPTLELARTLVSRDFSTGGAAKKAHLDRIDNLIHFCKRDVRGQI